MANWATYNHLILKNSALQEISREYHTNPENKNILSNVFLGGKFILLAKKNILRIPQTALGTRKKEEEGPQRVTAFAQGQHDP